MTNFFTKFQVKYRNAISLNKDLLLSGIAGFIVSLIVAYMSASYFTDDFTKSVLTVIIGFVSSKVIFHLDNKKKYTKRFSGRLNIPILKQ